MLIRGSAIIPRIGFAKYMVRAPTVGFPQGAGEEEGDLLWRYQVIIDDEPVCTLKLLPIGRGTEHPGLCSSAGEHLHFHPVSPDPHVLLAGKKQKYVMTGWDITPRVPRKNPELELFPPYLYKQPAHFLLVSQPDDRDGIS